MSHIFNRSGGVAVFDLTKNYFELFGLPVSCQVDLKALSSQYRVLQRAVHPDRFANDERQQLLAVQYASHVNDAFNTLKQPLNRAIYLLKLAGRDVDMERNTVMDTAFLMEQMELRESVDEVRSDAYPEKALESLMARVDGDIDNYLLHFEQCWQSAGKEDLDRAEAVVKKMQFMVKLAAELEALESDLLD
ncbi:Fe-S protein assembly co-chaperone HscB [Endozoicomonas ascidiicola]|uniref:Fe-S protein assembly co-chaperone HscB n=1 Tax=Endozoicomonas ascidiicola TaxID=1698521 RepID=UPI0020A34BC8|nr:Fe-S protein assembly co-chaperone HscB [Endozoicomonas ascidiicola]